MDLYRSDLNIQLSNLQESIDEILTKVRPKWDLQKLKKKNFSEGTINTLVACHVPEDEKDIVVFRVYLTDLGVEMINRQREFKCAEFLSKQGLGPVVIAVFQNGFCYQFFAGKTLTLDEMLEEPIYKKVAEVVADFHSCKPELNEELPMDLFDLLQSFPERFPITKNNSKFPGGFLTKQYLEGEQELLRKSAMSVGSPVVFCHRDLQPLNFIYDKDSDKMMIIDFEFAAYSYQAFDLAFYFTEYCGVFGRDPKRFPDESHRRAWLTIYADRFAQNHGQIATQDDINKLCKQVDYFIPVPHFVTSLLTLRIYLVAENETDDGVPGSESYVDRRFEEYFESKHYLPSLK